MLQHWVPQSLYSRILLAIIFCIAIVLTAVTTFDVQTSRTRLVDDILERATDHIEVLSHAANVYLHQQDAHQLTLVAKSGAEGQQVEFIAFYSPAGQLLAAAAAQNSPAAARVPFSNLPIDQANRTPTIRWTDGYLEVIKPLVYQGEPAGIVALRMNNDSLASELNRALMRGIVTTLVLIVVLSLSIAFLLRRFVISPLQHLSSATEQISAGVWSTPPGKERRDELGKLARAFERMVDTLRVRETQLQEQMTAIRTLNVTLDERVVDRTRELHEVVANQEYLLAQIQQMSTPVVPVLDGVIVMPIVGMLDTSRATQLVQNMLDGIQSHHARLAVLDITGVPVVDAQVAGALIQAAEASRLLGTRAVLVGIRPEVAQTLVQLGVDLSGIQTFATLQETLHSIVASTSRRPS
jgi:anti-anti-sigma regulatory factor/HAMP domain-containing protein